MTIEEFEALLGVIASQNKEFFLLMKPILNTYNPFEIQPTYRLPYFLLPAQTYIQQVNTLAEEFLDYNEDDANLNISPEVVDIEEIIDDKSVDNEQDLYSPPSIPLITTAQARSHLTELVQYLEALSAPNFLVEQSLI